MPVLLKSKCSKENTQNMKNLCTRNWTHCHTNLPHLSWGRQVRQESGATAAGADHQTAGAAAAGWQVTAGAVVVVGRSGVGVRVEVETRPGQICLLTKGDIEMTRINQSRKGKDNSPIIRFIFSNKSVNAKTTKYLHH